MLNDQKQKQSREHKTFVINILVIRLLGSLSRRLLLFTGNIDCYLIFY